MRQYIKKKVNNSMENVSNDTVLNTIGRMGIFENLNTDDSDPISLIKKYSSDIECDEYKPVLKKYLNIALKIEHTTIPPYLTAMYSIHDGKNKIANQIIRSVAVEEMLHMIMVCNVMNALGLEPEVNTKDSYPSYPSRLPFNTDFNINLERFSKENLDCFIKIEKPDKELVEAPLIKQFGSDFKTSFFKQYADNKKNIDVIIEELDKLVREKVVTIGQYYSFLEDLIYLLDSIYPGKLFTGDSLLQITPEEYYGSGGVLVAVNNMEDVRKVFQEIKDQGEGAEVDENQHMSMYDKDISQFDEGYELAHYYRFMEVRHEHFYIEGNYGKDRNDDGLIPITTVPNGKPLDIDWNAVYPIKMNAKLADYNNHPQILEQAIEFNKTYKRLMDAIQAAIEGNKKELPKSIMYMHALREQAVELMKQPLKDDENAAPTFEYIELKPKPNIILQ